MTTHITWAFLIFLPVLITAQVDLTRQPKAKGASVVEAVVDIVRGKCIFPNDRLFLRRLARVETDDGNDADTYGNGYYGGIWKVDENMFNETLGSSKLKSKIAIIQAELGINWSTVQWKDLEKPLFSGLAASLYLQTKNKVIPGDVTNQATYWENNYNRNGNSSDFIQRISSLKEVSCQTKPVDLVFIVDESGSIGPSNFQIMKEFIVNVTNQINVEKSAFQVGLVKFKGSASVEFNLGDYANKTDLQSKVKNMNYNSGGTSISTGINVAHQQVFMKSTRKDATKVAFLLTDGRSNIAATRTAADSARNDSIVIFAMGIGSINIAEMNAAANDPDCTHVFVLHNFNEIDSILYEVKKSACTAAKLVNYNTGKTQTVKVEVIKNATAKATLEIKSGKRNDTTIITETKCSSADIYISSDTTKPNKAFYEKKGHAEDGTPSMVKIQNDGKPIYMSYEAKMSNSSKCSKGSVNIEINDGPAKVASVICLVDGKQQTCSRRDLLFSKYKDLLCTTKGNDPWTDVPNPCKLENALMGKFFFPHPTDKSKFIRCNSDNKMFVTQCPPGEIYLDRRNTCGSSTPPKKRTGFKLPKDDKNPCNDVKYYFRYPKDKTMFIQCDQQRNARVMPCPKKLVWDEKANTCT